MKLALPTIAILLLLACCSSPERGIQKQDTVAAVSIKNVQAPGHNGSLRFERVNDSLANGTSLIKDRNTYADSAIGDFMARIWYLYGSAKPVFEGFQYTFRDKQTGKIFTAYCAGSGPAYGGDEHDVKALLPVIDSFEKLLARTPPADCELSFHSDYGMVKIGARNGVAYGGLVDEK